MNKNLVYKLLGLCLVCSVLVLEVVAKVTSLGCITGLGEMPVPESLREK